MVPALEQNSVIFEGIYSWVLAYYCHSVGTLSTLCACYNQIMPFQSIFKIVRLLKMAAHGQACSETTKCAEKLVCEKLACVHAKDTVCTGDQACEGTQLCLDVTSLGYGAECTVGKDDKCGTNLTCQDEGGKAKCVHASGQTCTSG